METDRFTGMVRHARRAGHLVIQSRMGFGALDRMRAGLRAVRDAGPFTAGTITLDSYTRCHDFTAARRALREHPESLNGFPLIAHGVPAVRSLLEETSSPAFPVQVRHGTPRPLRVLDAMVRAGVDATEGGPVSYCLPYSRVPLGQAVREWSAGCELLAAQPVPMHVETFGGCMLGQLCPPALLVALGVLEAMFFQEHGLPGVSLSYAQQVHPGQDREALEALRRLADERLAGTDHHIVLYTFMGVFPRTADGSRRLLAESVPLAVQGGADRLIVKTPVEAHRIPTIEENAAAIAFARSVADATDANGGVRPTSTGLYEEARALVDATLELGGSIGRCLVGAFARGILDVPFCMHPDNANRARTTIDARSMLRWSDAGGMPVTAVGDSGPLTARQLTELLTFNRRRFDRPAREPLGSPA